MKNKILKLTLVFALVLQFAIGGCVSAFADVIDREEEEDYVGKPEITVLNQNIFDVDPGKTNELEIKVRNISPYLAATIVVQISPADPLKNPFTVGYVDKSNKITAIPARGEKDIPITVDVAQTAESGTYEFDISFTMYNSRGEKAESTDKIYFRVKNGTSAPNFKLENYTLSPSSVNEGDTAVLSAVLRNIGPINMYNVKVSLEDGGNGSIGFEGVNSVRYQEVHAGTQETLSFKIVINSTSSVSAPVVYKLEYEDENGKDYTYEQKYYINLGGSASSAELQIINMSEPSGTYGVNENFKVSFDLYNSSDSAANNIMVKVSSTEGEIVPKSSSIISLRKLAPGESHRFEFTLAATDEAESKNYPIQITVEHSVSGGNVSSFSQYAGANISNGNSSSKSKPKIIVSDYTCDPLIVMAGEEFDLDMTFMNTHSSKAVSNVKMYLTMTEETASDNAKQGNVFTPVNSSNTFFFDSIPAKGTAQKLIRLYVIPDAQPKTYTLTVNFEYEDSSGNEYTTTELLGINVKQVTEIKVGDIYIPEYLMVGDYVSLEFDIINTGKVQLSNLMVEIDGDINIQSKSTYIGNLDSGSSEYFSGSFTMAQPGESNVTVKITYDDPSGETIEDIREFTVMVEEPYIPEEDPSMTEPENTVSIGKIILGVVILGALAGGLFIFIKRSKNVVPKDLDDDFEDDKEGIDTDEHL